MRERKKRMLRTKSTGKAAPPRYRATRADSSQRPALPIASECPPARRWTPGYAPCPPLVNGEPRQATCAPHAVSLAIGDRFPVCPASGGTRARIVRIRKKRMIRTKPTGKAASPPAKANSRARPARLYRRIDARLYAHKMQKFSSPARRLPLFNAKGAIPLRNGNCRV